MTENPTPQAGWYPDPAGTGRLRWFDGATWTEQYQAPAIPGSIPTPAGPPLAPPTAPRKRSWFARHKVLTGLGAAVVLVVVISVAANGGGSGDTPDAGTAATAVKDADATNEKPAADKPSAEKPAKADKTPGIGDAVRDGKFEFTVTKVQKGVAKVGDEFLNEKAQGQFVLVHVTVKNIGKEAQTFDDGNQTLRDADGRKFDADSEAGIYLDDSNAFLNDINPGNTVKGIVVFDVPKDAKLASIELHDAMFSGGVTVSLK
jgi:hypothetical protein